MAKRLLWLKKVTVGQDLEAPRGVVGAAAKAIQFKGENMKTRPFVSTILAFVLAATLTAVPASAQQTTGVPGSP